MTPLGYLFLDSPPDEALQLPDFRTVGDTPIGRPSPNLIDTVQAMRRRQAWMREYVIEEGLGPLAFVGSGRTVRNVASLAAKIRDTLGLAADWAENVATWEDALRALRDATERTGIVVAASGMVGLNTHRTLDPQEFRGFVLCDDFAPLIFVNAGDSKSAQMFTLAHELAHIWVGRDGLFNLIRMVPHEDEIERFCNQVAAEFLVPRHKLLARWSELKGAAKPFHNIGRAFKVSPLVAARRAWDLDLIPRKKFFAFYEEEQAAWRRRKAEDKSRVRKGGPDFYQVQDVRLGRRFAYAVVRAAREGRLLYREAYELTDLRGETFNKYAARLLQRMKNDRR
jgi:Zn-dependent peptidase ImmA (M78 family)